MEINFRLFTNTSSVESSEKVLNILRLKIGGEFTNSEIEKYPKGGHVCSFSIVANATSWNEVILEAISLGQKVAHSFQLTGDIQEEIDLFSSETSISGLNALHITCLNPN